MAITQNTYTGNGSNKLFSITFPYLETSDIDVYLNNVLQTITTQYFFANATTVEFVAAPGNGVTVLIKRSTDEATISNSFFPGSSIKAADLNDNFDQVLFLAQETNNNVANAVAGQIPDGTITSAKIADGTIVDVDVSATAGIVATKLAFTQAGAGAAARTIDSKLKDVVSVKDFGAIGDGTTNDTAAIQTAINSGSSLYFPKGTYLINSSITITVPSDIDPLAKFNITSGTFAFGPGTVDCIKPEWFYFGGGYQTAISKAFAVQRNSVTSVAGMAVYGSVIPVSLESNKSYVISGTITGQDYLVLHGNSASIQTAAAYPFNQTYPIINSIGYQPTIAEVTFAGGNNVLVFPENNQGFDIVIKKCRFTEWKGVSILSSTVPHAQHLMVTECEWTARTVDSCVCDIAFDSAIFDQCQYSGPSSTVFINRDSLTLTNWITSPLLPQGGETHPYSPRWIFNEGIALTVDAFRFGGEPGARRILYNNVGPVLQGNATSVSITNSNVYTGGDYLMELEQIPANFIFEENFGFTGGAPIKYSGSNVSNLLIGRNKIVIDHGGSDASSYGSKSNSDSGMMLQRVATAMNRDKQLGTQTILTSQKIQDVYYGSLSGSINPNFTVLNGTDLFGDTNQYVIGYDGNSFFNSYANWVVGAALTGQTAGIYTIVVNAQVGVPSFNSAPISFGINASESRNYWNLHCGRHTLSLQFYWDGTNNPSVGFSAYNINAGSSFVHNGFRLYSGAVDVQTWNSITYADAVPSTGYHRRGDRVIRLTPAVGQPKGWVCTTTGTSGTWVSEGNL